MWQLLQLLSLLQYSSSYSCTSTTTTARIVRATSPYLSLVMFVGCYLFCLAAIFSITQGSFPLSPNVFSATMCILLLSAVNAFSLTLTTLFIKLLRVYHIFKSSNHLKSNLGQEIQKLFFNIFHSLACSNSKHSILAFFDV